MSYKAEDQTHRKLDFMIKWQVDGTWEVLAKSSFPCKISMDMLRNVSEVLKMHMGGIESGK